MSDYNSSLPVRTENPGDVAVTVRDGTVPSQALNVDAAGKVTAKLNDGAGNSVTSQANGAQRALDVGIDVAGVQVDPRQIRALTTADQITVTQGTNPWVVKDQADGSVTGGTAGTQSLLAGAVFTSATGLTTPLTAAQQAALQFDANGRLLTNLVTALPAGANLIGAVNLDLGGTAVSATNPVPVQITSTPAGTLVNKYNTTTAVTVGATANHDYTVTATKTFTGKKFWVAASGKIRADVQISTDGTVFNTFWTSFNSTSDPNVSIDLGNVAITDTGAGAKVRIVLTNQDKAPQDVYSTISGTEA